MRFALLHLFACGLATVFASCGKGSASGPPANVVLVTLDTTRADHLSTYGYFRTTSPALDELAAESVVFERFVVPMATTLPTHLSMLTGTHPLEHGVLANATPDGGQYVPAPPLATFAELSQELGYDTAGFVSATPLKRGSGAEDGFAVYSQPIGKERRGDRTMDEALAWLARPREAPFFLWVHLYDAHYPFDPPPEFRGRFETDDALRAFLSDRATAASAYRPLAKRYDEAEPSANAYDAEILFADGQLGRLVEALRAREDWTQTALVVTGDHGEGLCQHELAAHGSTWNEQLHAPLVMRVPGVPARRVETLATASDILPTLSVLARLPHAGRLAAQASGRDVLASGASAAREIASQDTGRERTEDVPFRYSLTTERWKVFRLEHRDGRVTDELYDLENDPFELRDVAGEHPDELADMRERLERTLDGLRARGAELRAGADTAQPMDAERQAELEALGYLGEE